MDLRPSTDYFFRLRAHPSAAPSIVQGWLPPGAAVACRTKATAPGRPHHLARVGAPQHDAIELAWRAGSCPDTVAVEYWVQGQGQERAVARLTGAGAGAYTCAALPQPRRGGAGHGHAGDTHAGQATLGNLLPG